ncbi:hypothetical protein CDQ84_09880 [Clostridium thermosuccinogenes]|uniref:ABC transporter substrate-binding protein n=1 Tax=Clostridium thermosuccinogenes TaxID=84032 RepID=A0A2K2FJ80_9CLOT|nr:extracellular solute-binding protein [Pseudoclostridium thermosuccinogenes]AUS96867.1 hypothetical protein CDO33_10700 [Pseudoclostridium thermosuccinogenes]PNT96982.1 hypothetical protein CDQ85_09730 [Pseudoclostridium thermosuccinogenes]PNT98841.1 hypothetical protein CDQ84_09880 [Pseudoclostridium thermosuccinogenes]
MKRFLSSLTALILVLAMVLTMAACSGTKKESTSGTDSPKTNSTGSDSQSGDSKESEEDPFLTGEKPELNILTYYTNFNMKEQPSQKVVEEMTGYKVNWFNLPMDNPDEKLLLEIAGGTSYDLLMRMTPNQANQLYVQNALYDLKPYLDKYGQNIYAAVSDMAMASVTDEKGMIYGIPHESFDGPQPGGNPYGVLKGGIGFNTAYLEDLGMDIPTNIDQLYEILKKYTEKTGKAAFTQAAGGWNTTILAAFGMGDAGWYEVDGKYLPRIKHPKAAEYLAFMQKLYKEGLLDNDFPINTVQSAKEKFTNGTTIAYPVMFWDIDGIYSAFEAAGVNAKVKVATYLAPDANTAPHVYVNHGISHLTCIPKTAKNPEHAMIWFNTISDVKNFKKIYIGEEGVTYEIKNGSYYPIFPAFADYTNSDKFTGVVPTDRVFEMWQARVRKTDAMSEMYDQMNSRINEYTIYNYYESYASSIEAVQKNKSALDKMVDDSLIQAIVSGEDPQTAINKIIANWDKNGGAEYENAMETWYAENKSKFN